MSVFKKIFGQKSPTSSSPQRPAATPKSGTGDEPKMIRVFDNYGREHQISREEWRTKVLPANLQKTWNEPEGLYSMIVSALNDGFRSEVIAATKHLYEIDPEKVRGACMWGVVLKEEDRLDEAEAVFRDATARYGENGIIFTNWAKIYFKRGNTAKMEELLWHALELDPNQSNAVGWYEVLYRERSGREAGLEALLRVAALPGSWRARLWLARAEMENRQLEAAVALYSECLSLSPRPVPGDLLMQMSGDLGNKGHLPEIIALCEPYFDAQQHGIQVGNNLIKAHLDLGQFEAASQILNRLYALKRPDWQQNLSFWDTAIAKARVETNNPPPANLKMGMLSLKEPVWLREDSPALNLFLPKLANSPVIALLGSSAQTGVTQITHGLSDAPGRLSRALPLFLAEQIHLTSTGVGIAVTPWITGEGGGGGFAVSGMPWKADETCANARQSQPVADYLVTFHINALEEPWRVEMILYRTIDHAVLDSTQAHFTPGQPETAFVFLSQYLRSALEREAGLAPVTNPHYQVPSGDDFPYYMLRLEQALAVSVGTMKSAEKSFLSGERDIILGNIQLNLNQPQNVNVRLLLAQTLKKMKEVHPQVLSEFREKIDLLQREKPLQQPAQGIVQALFDQIFAAQDND